MKENISLYIHIPFCLSKCSYCDFFSVRIQKEISDNYVDALCKEIEYRIREFDVVSFSTIFIGGGTPSLLNEEQLKKIFSVIKPILTNNAEITIEINPDDVTEKFIEMCKKLGVTRISCGIQSLNEKSLEFAGRRASLTQTRKALEILKKYWSGNLSLDLICGLPYETEESFMDGLNEIIDFNPSHISIYSLVLEEETPMGQYFINHEYDYDTADDMWIAGKSLLVSKGYMHYEVSNFCKPGKECQHNLVYWNHKDYIGCGSGGTGSIYYADGSAFRYTNTKNIENYCRYWINQNFQFVIPQEIENLSIEDSKYEFFMMGLRKKTGISSNYYNQVFNSDIPENVVILFEKWKEKNLCEIDKIENDIIYRLNEDGIMYLNKFLQELEIL